MSFRLDHGGSFIDRSRPISFTFDGVRRSGFHGDTLASALLGEGVGTFATSLYRGRPRGPIAAGREEAAAFVGVAGAGIDAPTMAPGLVPLAEDLVAEGHGGRGRLRAVAESRRDHAHRHCDVLVIGGGAAGLAAAEAASSDGARVILVEAQEQLGGWLLDQVGPVVGLDGATAEAWTREIEARLAARPEVMILKRATALGLYDQGFAVVAQSRRLWHLRARRVLLATGATERPIAFAGNDRPGVMLAGSALRFLRRWGVAVGRRVVVFTADDGAYAVAAAMAEAGIEVAAIVDPRPGPGQGAAALAARHGIEVLHKRAVAAVDGETGVEAVRIVPSGGAAGREELRLEADALLVSGGWNPAADLITHTGSLLRWDEEALAYLPPARSDDRVTTPVGACAGPDDPAAVGPRAAIWSVPPPAGRDEDECFVDLQRDVTLADLRRAVEAGLRSPEHVKRYTTLGTGGDQGRTANALALGILAEMLDTSPEEMRPTSARPPAVPAPFELLAGRNRGSLHDPIRTTPIHDRHLAAGAVFEDVGQWKRPLCYQRPGEDIEAATRRECVAVRTAVGLMDVSTLGKIDVHGPDAAEFLDRMYTGVFSSLAVGACKYGILCHADGMVFDDGVLARLAADRYLVSTTTSNAAAVLEWFEEWLQTEWPHLRVHCTSVTEQWAGVALAGPRSRAVLARLAPDVALDDEAFPFMTVRDTVVAGLPARLSRVSFSGELAFEIHVAGTDGTRLWDEAMAAGASQDIAPYGTEAMHVLRAEKGFFIVGQETDGSVTPQDLGYGWAVSKDKSDFIGARSHRREAIVSPDRRQLVALLPETRVVEGAQVALPGGADERSIGHVTSSYESATLGRPFALAMVRRGRERIGGTLRVTHGDGWVDAVVAEPVLYDPDGARRDG
jgi:sarcosine oxidase, subunit alpha